MLQSRLTSLRWTIRASVFLGVPFWIFVIVCMCKDGDGIAAKIVMGLIVAVLSIGYLVVRYFLEYQACEDYLVALQNKDFQSALTLGRTYYGYRRSGLKGAAGTYLTVYDEQAINNDSNAYSK